MKAMIIALLFGLAGVGLIWMLLRSCGPWHRRPPVGMVWPMQRLFAVGPTPWSVCTYGAGLPGWFWLVFARLPPPTLGRSFLVMLFRMIGLIFQRRPIPLRWLKWLK